MESVRKRKEIPVGERLEKNREDFKNEQEKKYALVRKVIELENLILGTPDLPIYKGHTKFEMLYGKLQKTATKEEMLAHESRKNKIATMSKKPYNRYYVEQLEKIKKKIKKVQDEKQRVLKRIKTVIELNEREDPDYPCEEIFGRPFSSLNANEIADYERIVRRAKEERRKMELGLPPYDRLKKN